MFVHQTQSVTKLVEDCPPVRVRYDIRGPINPAQVCGSFVTVNASDCLPNIAPGTGRRIEGNAKKGGVLIIDLQEGNASVPPPLLDDLVDFFLLDCIALMDAPQVAVTNDLDDSSKCEPTPLE